MKPAMEVMVGCPPSLNSYTTSPMEDLVIGAIGELYFRREDIMDLEEGAQYLCR